MKKRKYLISILILLLLLLSSCIYFQTIYQPSVSLPNEIIIVSITANTTGGEYQPYFGVCLPIGWTVQGDSLQCSGAYNEVIYYDSLVSFMQENESPAPDGYYWWAGKGVSDTASIGEVYADLFIQTDNQTGIFSIDYMLGNSGWGVNQQRSNGHQIEIVDEYTPSGLHATVVGESIILNWIKPSNTSGLLGYNIYRDEQKINSFLVTDTTFIDGNPLEGVHGYSVSSFYDNGSEFLMPYEVLVLFGNSLYVSPSGSNSNSGTSFNDALQTITFATSIIVEDSLRPITIFLAPGYYSPFTNEEHYPINCRSYVSLVGSGEYVTFLYADGQNTVLKFLNSIDDTIDGLTITNGLYGIRCDSSRISFSNVTISNNTSYTGIECNNSNLSLINVTITDNNQSGINCDGSVLELLNVNITNNNKWEASGGGIHCNSSTLDLANVIIANNGGGIYCRNSTLDLVTVNITDNNTIGSGGGINCEYSALNLVDVNINNNNAREIGGGINCNNSILDLAKVNIINNSAGNGGGINCHHNSFLNFDDANRCNIYFNRAAIGNDLYSDVFLNVAVDTFTVYNPTTFHANPIENFTFDILQGMVIQVEADLFVSPEGSDINSGLTENDPLKTIHRALTKMLADSLHPHIINLLEGTYSDSITGEFFPVSIIDFVNLTGKSDSTVILNGHLNIYGNKATHISDLTIVGGRIYCENSNASFSRLTIEKFYCRNASPSLKNMIIANSGGMGVTCNRSSSPTLENVIIHNHNNDGMQINDNSNPILNNVTVFSNRYEGITCTDNSKPILENVTVFDNRGGVQCWDSASPTLINATIVDNVTGVECRSNSRVTLVNATISDNYGSGIWCTHNNILTLTNCILWDNLGGSISGSDSAIVTYSNIDGGWVGQGNINAEPLFVGSGNYPYILSGNSPCIDAGNPDSVFNDPEDPLNPGFALWPAHGTIRNDMGAYGGPNATSWNIIVGVEDEIEDFQTPTKFKLSQNYPNPFNPSTTIQYSLKEKSSVELILYDILGAQVEVLVNEEQNEGYYNINFNGGYLASGIYFYRLQAGDFIETKKMLLLK